MKMIQATLLLLSVLALGACASGHGWVTREGAVVDPGDERRCHEYERQNGRGYDPAGPLHFHYCMRTLGYVRGAEVGR